MKRVDYEVCWENLTHDDLDSIERYMSKEELLELSKKMSDIVGTIIHFDSYDSRVMAEKFFKLGYLASHARFTKLES